MSLVWGKISLSTPHRGVSFRPRPHCGSKRKCIRIVVMRTVENGRKRIKMRVCSMCIEFNLRHNVQFYRFRTFHEKCGWTVKTYQNGSVDANRSMLFCILLKTHQCGQGHSYTQCSNCYKILQSSPYLCILWFDNRAIIFQ